MARGASHYGCRACRFISGHEETWTVPTASEPYQVFWRLVHFLTERGLSKDVSFIGVSAGVDTVLSLVSEQTDLARGGGLRIQQVVLIAGVYHPTVFPAAWQVLQRENAGVLVHHHEKDKLCPWGPAKQFWADCRERRPDNVFINT